MALPSSTSDSASRRQIDFADEDAIVNSGEKEPIAIVATKERERERGQKKEDTLENREG